MHLHVSVIQAGNVPSLLENLAHVFPFVGCFFKLIKGKQLIPPFDL